MNQQDVDLLLARAQIALAFLFAICIFGLVFLLVLHQGSISPTTLTIITTVITALVTILTLIANFFYARQRPAALPDPTTTSTTTTTVTTPTPTVVPEGSQIIAAPGPPQAVVTSTLPTQPGAPNAPTAAPPAPPPAV